MLHPWKVIPLCKGSKTRLYGKHILKTKTRKAHFKDSMENTCDEGLTPTKDGGTCLTRLSMFRKEVH